jgi:hypothetical protein
MRTLAILGCIVSIATLCAVPAEAQTWSSPRTRPVLWQLISIDESGEPGWPYGGEDIAGDGLASFEADEAASDLRTVYADADASRTWIRAYVASELAPADAVIVYFFVDGDERDDTGGEAEDSALWPELAADPSGGGYEHVVAARGDGTLQGAWRWDAQAERWSPVTPRPADSTVQIDVDLDPIRIGDLERGYVQIELAHQLTGLDASCSGRIFVRSWHDDAPARAFGDDDVRARACRPTLDVFGDPDVLREPGCDADSDCPADGRCREGVCLFTSGCSAGGDCRDDERCLVGACVRVVEGSCDADADCNGLVCRTGDCVECAENGAQACDDPLLCSPNGQCVDPERGPPTAGRGGTGGAGSGGRGGRGGTGGGTGGDGATPPGKVRGGAFQCATVAPIGSARARGGAWWLVLVLALPVAFAFARVRRGRRTRALACKTRPLRTARWS